MNGKCHLQICQAVDDQKVREGVQTRNKQTNYILYIKTFKFKIKKLKLKQMPHVEEKTDKEIP